MGPWRCLAFQCIGNPQVCFKCPQNKGFLCFHGGRLNKESKAERALLGHRSVHPGGTATQHFTFSHSVQIAGYSKLEPSLGKRNLMVIMNYRRVKVGSLSRAEVVSCWVPDMLSSGLLRSLAEEKAR